MKQFFSLFSSQPKDSANPSEECAARLRRVTAQHKEAAERESGKRVIFIAEKTPIGAQWIGSAQFSWGEREGGPKMNSVNSSKVSPIIHPAVAAIVKKIPQAVRELLAA